jgi:simple sugar transport system substrate-binding protein
MERRTALGLIGLAGLGFAARPARAQMHQKQLVMITDLMGTPWSARLEKGLSQGGQGFFVNTHLIGPSEPDTGRQAALMQRLIDGKEGPIDAIALLPLETAALSPLVQSARDAGMLVLTLQGSAIEGRSWDIEPVDPAAFGALQMQALAQEMGGQGKYVIYVGTLAMPAHTLWAEAAIAHQKAHFPAMSLAAPRFPDGFDLKASARITAEIIESFPDLGGILAFGENGVIGAAQTIAARNLGARIAVVGTALPSQARDLLLQGAIRRAFCWSPSDAGLALASVAGMIFTGHALRTGVEVPGLGLAAIEPQHHVIRADRVITIDRASLPGLLAQGL